MAFKIIAGLALMISAPAGALHGAPMPIAGPSVMDVAGVRLGTTPDAVREALVRAGYRIERVDRTQDFRQVVANKVAELRRQVSTAKQGATGGILANGAAGERLQVTFDQWPEGARVVAVSFFGDGRRQAVDAFKAQVASKYGKRTGPILGSDRWCSAGERTCGPLGRPALPTLDADYYQRTLFLKSGSDEEQAQRALVEREVRKIVPLDKRSAF